MGKNHNVMLQKLSAICYNKTMINLKGGLYMFLFTTSSIIGDSIINILYKILLSLDSIIYSLISWLYQVFNILASCQLFKSEFYTSLSQRIYVIIGVITLFILSYQLLLLVINPDENKIFGVDFLMG